MDKSRNNNSKRNSKLNKKEIPDKLDFNFHKLRKHYLVVFIIAIIVNFLILVAGFIFKTAQSLIYAGFFIVIFSITVLSILIFKQQKSIKNKLKIVGISFFLIIILICVVHELNVENQAYSPTRTMLSDRFFKEFMPACEYLTPAMKFNYATELDTFKFWLGVHTDFEARSYYVGLYFPKCRNLRNTFTFMKTIPLFYDSLIINDNILQTTIQENNSSKGSVLNDLIFTRVIYLYHDDVFNASKVNYLKSVFKTYDLILYLKSNISEE